ncbi:zona pellucida sperm-binding protein 3-like [Trichomycterus rosablanca]|uniref:zona pellucida sperm-binding protein 3-like n=1 Tax=Trichomycterus rosablanca TaxID=2290929 RepID=UPI002F3557F8
MGLNQFLLVALLIGAGSSQMQWSGLQSLFQPGVSHPGVSHPGVSHPNQPMQVNSAGMPTQVTQTGSSVQAPARLPLMAPVQGSLNVRSSQVFQGPVKPMNWRFPVMPTITRPAPVQFDRPIPAAPQSVAALCTEKVVYVEVKKDLFGTGEPVDVAALSLGGCGAVGEDPALQILIFQSELQGCGSNVIVTEDELVYVFTLIYGSTLSGSPIVRTLAGAGSTVLIECHYPRFHNVSSNPLIPLWIPHASAHVAEEQLVFSLRLMMDDWVSERASNQYFLGEFINMEASVVQFNHVPLRVYVDGCVATIVPDVNAVPRYFFIDNHGCFVDAKLTGGKSHFIFQSVGEKLGFQLEAFRFQQTNSSLIYFTCLLKATAASFSPSADTKACSFTGNGWVAAYGDSGVCSCCDGNCSARKRRDLSDQGLQIERRVRLGPIVVENY